MSQRHWELIFSQKRADQTFLREAKDLSPWVWTQLQASFSHNISENHNFQPRQICSALTISFTKISFRFGEESFEISRFRSNHYAPFRQGILWFPSAFPRYCIVPKSRSIPLSLQSPLKNPQDSQNIVSFCEIAFKLLYRLGTVTRFSISSHLVHTTSNLGSWNSQSSPRVDLENSTVIIIDKIWIENDPHRGSENRFLDSQEQLCLACKAEFRLTCICELSRFRATMSLKNSSIASHLRPNWDMRNGANSFLKRLRQRKGGCFGKGWTRSKS
jgi:hypothetical protein